MVSRGCLHQTRVKNEGQSTGYHKIVVDNPGISDKVRQKQGLIVLAGE